MCLLGINSIIGQIKVKGYIEAGYYQEASSLRNASTLDIDRLIYEGCMYTEVFLHLHWRNIHVEQNIKDISKYKEGYSLDIMEIAYNLRMYYSYKNIGVGYEHECIHPVTNVHNTTPLLTRRGSHNKIFIRLNFGAN